MKKSVISCTCLLSYLFIAGSLSVLAQKPMLWDYALPTLHTWQPSVKTYDVYCYNATTGKILDCGLTLNLYYDCSWVPPEELLNYAGGHMHPQPQPCTAGSSRPAGVLAYESGGAVLKGTQIQTQTLKKKGILSFTAPQVSGVDTIYLEYIFPSCSMCYPVQEPGWVWVRLTPDRLMAYTLIGIDVGLGGLEELPAMPNWYVRCGLTAGCLSDNPYNNPKHPEVFYGTSYLIRSVQELAYLYRTMYPTEKLRITDMSLPAGGLFDLDYHWDTAKGHKDHRVGTAVDISQYALLDSGGTETINKKALAKLAKHCHLSRYMGESTIHFNYKS